MQQPHERAGAVMVDTMEVRRRLCVCVLLQATLLEGFFVVRERHPKSPSPLNRPSLSYVRPLQTRRTDACTSTRRACARA